MIKILLFLLLLPSLAVSQQQTARVLGISDGLTVKLLSPSGSLTSYQLTAIQPIFQNQKILQFSKKRLMTLIMGKTIQIQTTSSDQVLIFWGGLNINLRLIEEGLSLINEQSLKILNINQQQHFITAQENAKRNRRGIWANQNPSQFKKFYYPQTTPAGLPLPMIRAPVFIP